MELDSLSGIYDGNSIYQYDNQVILERYPKQVLKNYLGRGALLELGLGHGFSAQAFSGYFDSHTVIEGSLKVIEQHRELLQRHNINIINSFFEDFETDKKYDLIVAGFVLEHVENPKNILSKYLKFLNESGMLIVAVPNSDSLNRRIGLYSGLLSDLNLLSEHDKKLGHLRYFNYKSLLDLVENADGHIEFVEGIFLKVASSTQLQKLNLETSILDGYCQLAEEYPELSCALLAGISPRKGS
jgi:SAM-dependent methyltransferase